jgi:hypothetical protein
MFQLVGNSYYLNGLLCGLKQLNPAGGWFKHDPHTGWQIDTPPIDECQQIYLQDDLTYKGDKVIELENYIRHYGTDIGKITFYTWHKGLKNVYPSLNLVWYPFFLKQHLDDAIAHKDVLTDNFNFYQKTEKFLCLNARIRPHRDVVFKKIRDNKNCLSSYTHRGIKSTLSDDWSVSDYRDWNLKRSDYLRNTKNLLVASPLYNQTSFSLVTETQCFLALHPALFVSNQNHVKILREWGFDLFDDIFDHSYDLVDNDSRIDKLFKDNTDIINKGLVINHDIQTRLLKNRELYFTKFSEVVAINK